jgi:hypothetical protein
MIKDAKYILIIKRPDDDPTDFYQWGVYTFENVDLGSEDYNRRYGDGPKGKRLWVRQQWAGKDGTGDFGPETELTESQIHSLFPADYKAFHNPKLSAMVFSNKKDLDRELFLLKI